MRFMDPATVVVVSAIVIVGSAAVAVVSVGTVVSGSLHKLGWYQLVAVVTQVVMLPMLSDVLHPEGHFVFLFALTPDIHNEGGSHRA